MKYHILTSWHYAEDTRLLLLAQVVSRPAQEAAELPVTGRTVADGTSRAVNAELLLCDIHALRRVVELPRELHVAGVSLNFAAYPGLLLPGHAEAALLAGSAHWYV